MVALEFPRSVGRHRHELIARHLLLASPAATLPGASKASLPRNCPKKLARHTLTGRTLLFVAEGKEARAVEQARVFLEERGLPASQISEVCADMSPAYAKGVREQFPLARLVFDFFHVVQLLTTAVDTVRRRESARF